MLLKSNFDLIIVILFDSNIFRRNKKLDKLFANVYFIL
jgi:hypothetical protein